MRFLFSFTLCLFSIFCFADGVPITGNTSVSPGATEVYTVNWEFWGSVYENYANVTWTVTGGTVLSSDKHTATIQWDDIPSWENGTGTIDVYEDLGSQEGTSGVNIVNFVLGTSEFCNGVLGPAVIAENFGQGNNPGPPISSGTTTYTYQPFCYISPNQYTLVNDYLGCNGYWHNISQDHTGNANGYFLIVDASSDPGEFYRAIISGLGSTFRYQFSVWAGNVDLPSAGSLPGYTDPRIIFEIRDLNNNLLQSSNIIQLPLNSSFTWQQISFMFDIPPGITSVQIVIKTTNGGDIGNDIALDDISFAPCYPPIIASFSNGVVIDKAYICNNGTVNLFSWWPTPSAPYTNPGFQWQKSLDNGATWTNISGATSMNVTQTENTAGIYQYRMRAYDISNPSQFVISNVITYFVQKMVVEAKTINVFDCDGTTHQLNPNYYLQYGDPAISPVSYTFNWSPSTYLSNSQIANPNITLSPLPPGNNDPYIPPPPGAFYYYTLTVQNTNYGCSASNTQTIAQYTSRTVWVPSAFTPNGDGLNDLFRPLNLEDYLGAYFHVYNRWGQLIFSSTGPTLQDYSWDGTMLVNNAHVPQPADVYVWVVYMPGCTSNFVGAPGSGAHFVNNSPPLLPVWTGTVTLIR